MSVIGAAVGVPGEPNRADVPAIELRGVSRSFRLASGETLVAVDDVSLTIEPGEFVCVLGPSGHGKSTMLNLIAGFVKPTSGEVIAHGEPVSGPGADRGVIFQRDTLFLWRRVKDNIGYGLKARGVPRSERDQIVERLMEAAGLSRFARAWPRQLSGGMRRRTAIAAVFANEPSVLLMDEPFVGLDYARRAVLHEVLLEMWTRVGNTVFFVTHDVDEALTLASRILVVVHGRIVLERKVDLPRPRHPDTLASPEITEVRRTVLERLETALVSAHENERSPAE